MRQGDVKYVCDRCGTESDVQPSRTARVPFRWAHLTLPGVVSDREICPDCILSLRAWWYSPAEVSA